MPEIGVTIEGGEELMKKLSPDLLKEVLRRLLLEAALTVERRVKEYSPVDTGRMRASFTSQIAPDTLPLWSSVGSPVEYASFVEFGKGHPRGVGQIPFLQPALEDSKADIDRLIDEAAAKLQEEWQK